MTPIILCAREYCEKVNAEGRVPFPFEQLLAFLPQFKVFMMNFPQDILGTIALEQDDHIGVYVAQDITKDRQDVVLAHLLAHGILHQDLLRKMGRIVLSPAVDGQVHMVTEHGSMPQINQEALLFTFELLMPEALTKKAWTTLNSIQQLASVFRLPVSFVAQRLAALGLFA